MIRLLLCGDLSSPVSLAFISLLRLFDKTNNLPVNTHPSLAPGTQLPSTGAHGQEVAPTLLPQFNLYYFMTTSLIYLIYYFGSPIFSYFLKQKFRRNADVVKQSKQEK